MLTFKEFLAEAENRFIHGTTREKSKSIRKNWLQPKTSEYTEKLYGHKTEPTVFLAHDKDTKRAFSSIRGQIATKLKKHPSDVDAHDIEKHGALVVTRAHDSYGVKRKENDGTHKDLEGNRYYDDGPSHAEPGDYWTHDEMEPTGILKGKRLVAHLKKQGLIGKVTKL